MVKMIDKLMMNNVDVIGIISLNPGKLSHSIGTIFIPTTCLLDIYRNIWKNINPLFGRIHTQSGEMGICIQIIPTNIEDFILKCRQETLPKLLFDIRCYIEDIHRLIASDLMLSPNKLVDI
jgi:hypothetical protein